LISLVKLIILNWDVLIYLTSSMWTGLEHRYHICQATPRFLSTWWSLSTGTVVLFWTGELAPR